jgi:hypothetical protein
LRDGQDLANSKVKRIVVDIATYIRKYQIKPPKMISKLPQDYIDSQKVFYDRAYLEILELCSETLDNRTKE